MALSAQQYSEHLKKFLDDELVAGQPIPEDVELDKPLVFVDESSSPGLQDLDRELEQFRDHEVIRGILDQGCELGGYAREVEEKLRHAELDSIQDYIQESDNLVALHDQVGCAWRRLLSQNTIKAVQMD